MHFHYFHVEGLPKIPSYPGLSICFVFLRVIHQMFYLRHCEHGQRLNDWVLLGVMKGYIILVDRKLHMSVSGNLLSGVTSFLHK